MSTRKKPRVSRIWKGVKAVQPRDPMKRMMLDHEDVLQNIETVIVICYRDDRRVDDRVVADALRPAIDGRMPSEELARVMVLNLGEMRKVRADIPEAVWRDGLCVVLNSVHRHSDCRPGSTDYLDFVSPFIH